MAILVINCGSSSVKFALFDDNGSTSLAKGIVERIGAIGTSGEFSLGNADPVSIAINDKANHARALECLIHSLQTTPALGSLTVSAIGHRVVHGGEKFPGACLIDAGVIARIRELAALAPLHNHAHADGIEAARAVFPNVPQVAVFDTSFYQSVAPEVYRYALPDEYYRKHGVRRYGFHGTSHQFVTREAVARFGLDPGKHRILSAHLGNGCSATAVVNGEAVDTSMGITPLEGLVMGTRSGNVDPNLHQYLMTQTGMTLDEVTDLLNKKSGLMGLSGISNDLRTLAALYREGHEMAVLAIDVFCFRLARELGGLIVALRGTPDALVFTGGIGENSTLVRAKTLDLLKPFGFQIDTASNELAGKTTNGIISRPGGFPIAAVIPTNEERAIAETTRDLAL